MQWIELLKGRRDEAWSTMEIVNALCNRCVHVHGVICGEVRGSEATDSTEGGDVGLGF